MQRQASRGLWKLLAVAPIAFAAVAVAQQRVDDVVTPVTRVSSEQAVGGLTPQEFLDRQEALHQRLVALLPAATERLTVSVALTDLERAELADAANSNEVPVRVGVVKEITPAIAFSIGKAAGRSAGSARGVVVEKADSVWVTTVTSPDAVALRVHFTDVSIPEGAELYFFNDLGEAYGPYVGTGPNGTGEFWSNSVMGDKGIVVLRGSHLERASLKITEVGHVATDFPNSPNEGSIASFCSFNASCVYNNACVNEPAVNDNEGAVAKMRWIAGQYIYICSGGLLADTDPGTQIPYFLTANHCLSTNSVASNLEAYFQYSIACGSTACAGSFNPAPSPSTLGATVAATGTAGDFTLLTLNETPPAGSVFMGWNNTAIANSNGADLHRVSHPSGAPQAYSHHQVDPSSPTCTGWPRGQRIYSKDVYGATEGGSSGSPVVNAAGEVVGQLSGCCGYNCANECDSANNWTVDGALAYYWNSVAPYLNPAVGCTTNGDCDDGSVCTTDVCSGGSCSNTPITCNDGDACTSDSCNASTGCVFSPITCNDGNACTTDSCDSGSGCNYTPITCSGGQVCEGGVCVDPPTCGAKGDVCTSNSDCCSNKCRGRGTKHCR